MINIHTFFYFFTALISTILGLLVFLRNRSNPINQTWCLLGIAVSVWGFGFGMMLFATVKANAVFWGNFSHFGASLIAVIYLHFVLSILSSVKEKIRFLYFLYCVSIVLAFVSLTPWFIRGYTSKMQFNYYFQPGPVYLFFAFNFFATILYANFQLIKKLNVVKGHLRNQLTYVLIASLIGFGAGATTFPLVFNIPLYPLGGAVFFYNIIITFAIVRYRLMDITVAVTRASIFIAVYTLVLGLPFAVAGWFRIWLIAHFGVKWWTVPLGLMGVLATAGPFIYIFIDRRAEVRLLREQRRYQDTLKQASVGMTRIRNLRKLLDLITHIVTRTVRISYAAVYLYNAEAEEYVLQVSRDKGRVFMPKLARSNPLITWITENREAIVYEEIRHQMQDSTDIILRQIEENMRLLGAAVIIPSFLEDKFLGFIVLGEKMSGAIYTSEDLNVFRVLASQAALAIENAQFYEDAKEMQDQIAQAEKMATVGTMADGLSHQINNRFYALSLIAGDSIDTIKMTDTTKCTPEIKEMINQINHALERIQTNVMQGGEVVKGILKYTRKGNENFEALTLDQIIDQTLDMVQYKVRLSDVDIARSYPNDTPKIIGNSVQLQEAFFNFIDNAYDAIMERKATLNEPGFRGRINISAQPKTSDILEIIIEDNGMGIREELTKKVFTPFFTTKISARKGTGLGLYVIRKIITENHKGAIAFESDYKVGTRFILGLPIAR